MADSYFWSPNIDMSDYYSGNMAPPAKHPANPNNPDFANGGYRPYSAPEPQSSGLTTRKVQSVAVNPFTGSPVMVAADGARTPPMTAAQHSAFRDMSGLTRLTPTKLPEAKDGYSPAQLAAIPGTTRKYGNAGAIEELTYAETQRQNPALEAIGNSVMVAMPRRRPANAPSPMINLSFSPSQVGGQNMANSAGKPIRFGNGKIYHPMPEYGPPPVTGAARQPVMRAPTPPVLPSYATTDFQQDRFQTTSGAQMPGSMANSRWTTGY